MTRSPLRVMDLKFGVGVIPAFPKPGQIRKQKPAFREFADGRLVFDLTTKAGRDGYTYSVRKMFEWQGKRCGLIIAPQCKEKQGRWPLSMMTFDHGAGRGWGQEDGQGGR